MVPNLHCVISTTYKIFYKNFLSMSDASKDVSRSYFLILFMDFLRIYRVPLTISQNSGIPFQSTVPSFYSSHHSFCVNNFHFVFANMAI